MTDMQQNAAPVGTQNPFGGAPKKNANPFGASPNT